MGSLVLWWHSHAYGHDYDMHYVSVVLYFCNSRYWYIWDIHKSIWSHKKSNNIIELRYNIYYISMYTYLSIYLPIYQCYILCSGNALLSVRIFFKDSIYLFQREGKGERKRGRESSMWETLVGCVSCAPNQGPGPQPRHVPWLGIKPATFWFTGQRSIHWATRARAKCENFLTTQCGY